MQLLQEQSVHTAFGFYQQKQHLINSFWSYIMTFPKSIREHFGVYFKHEFRCSNLNLLLIDGSNAMSLFCEIIIIIIKNSLSFSFNWCKDRLAKLMTDRVPHYVIEYVWIFKFMPCVTVEWRPVYSSCSRSNKYPFRWQKLMTDVFYYFTAAMLVLYNGRY